MLKANNIKEMFLLVITSLVVWKAALILYDKSLEQVLDPLSTSEDEGSSLLNAPFMHLQDGKLGTSNERIFHFVQVTDIHISRYHTVGGLSHLEAFLYHELPLIAPDLVVCTGDLTDAKADHALTSKQHREEWLAYHSALTSAGVLKRNKNGFWLDQRGNHDCWNVPSFDSSENFYSELSAVKKEGYHVVLHKPFGTYSFIAVDGCPEVGAGRPLNFFGIFDIKDMNFLVEGLNRTIRENHNHTFAMSHYPIGTTYYGKSRHGLSFFDITQHVSIWLSGHLHKLAGGLGETMYAFQNDKVLELELGDMKIHGLFRIVVVDNDLVSFRDLSVWPGSSKLPIPHSSNQGIEPFKRPPIVVITNPKDGRYRIPRKEPYRLIKKSTHIRALVWGTSRIQSVTAYIDQIELSSAGEYNGRGKSWDAIDTSLEEEPYIPLWTVKWDPLKYDDNAVHYLSVVAVDEYGQSDNQTVRFRVDGRQIADMDAGPGGFIISLPLGLLFKELYVISYLIISVGFLLLPKLFYLLTDFVDSYDDWKKDTVEMLVEIDKETQLFAMSLRPPIRTRVRHKLYDFKFIMVATFLRFCELSRINQLFYPLYLFSLYVAVGPWFIGDFIPSSLSTGKRFGWLMTYGIWFQDGTWEPVFDTWLYAWYSIVYTLFPLAYFLSMVVTPPNLMYSKSNLRYTVPIHKRWYVRLLVVAVLVYHAVDTISMTIFYGLVATVISPGRTWILIWAIIVLKKRGAFSGSSRRHVKRE